MIDFTNLELAQGALKADQLNGNERYFWSTSNHRICKYRTVSVRVFNYIH